jgi:hypothetical protein
MGNENKRGGRRWLALLALFAVVAKATPPRT